MKRTEIVLHTGFQIARVDPRVFGGFLEHMGRAVYEGVYDPGSRHSDAAGFRSDVLGALRRLDMTAMRYPGGNFASGYHWRDGVGPRASRPTVRELAWQSIETNHFGTDEYISLCRIMGWTPMLTANLGTGTPEEARNWVEYCNCPAGTRYADMRVAEYLKFRGRLRRMGRLHLRRRLHEVIQLCDLAPLRNARIGSLSNGFRRRVCIADAILHEPAVLLLDDPLAACDPDQAEKLAEMLGAPEICASRTLLFTTHSRELVQAVATRILFLDRGKVAADIPGTDCLRNASLPAMFGQWRAEAADGAGGAA